MANGDGDEGRMKRLAESATITVMHRLVSIVALPLIVGAISWTAHTFDSMRHDVRDMKRDVAEMKKKVKKSERNLMLLNLKVFGTPIVVEDRDDD